MPNNKSPIALVQLISGEQVIGEVLDGSITEGSLTLRTPHVVVPQQAEEGKIRIAMAPWVFYFKGEQHTLTLREAVIAFAIDAPEGLAQQYSQLATPIDLSHTGLASAGGLILPRQ